MRLPRSEGHNRSLVRERVKPGKCSVGVVEPTRSTRGRTMGDRPLFASREVALSAYKSRITFELSVILHLPYAAIVQWRRRLTSDQDDAGSSPAGCTSASVM